MNPYGGLTRRAPQRGTRKRIGRSPLRRTQGVQSLIWSACCL